MTESPTRATAAEAQAALDAITATQTGVAQDVVVPPGYDAIYGVASGVFVLAIALFNAPHAGAVQIVIAVALFLASLFTLGALMRWFRRVNGVWISGTTPPRARWMAWAAGITSGVGVFLGSLAGDGGHWGLVAVVAAVTALGAGIFSRLWLTVYRAETGTGR